jgi:hypothetical protein
MGDDHRWSWLLYRPPSNDSFPLSPPAPSEGGAGRNHIILDLTDNDRPFFLTGRAIVAKSGFSTTSYRLIHSIGEVVSPF